MLHSYSSDPKHVATPTIFCPPVQMNTMFVEKEQRKDNLWKANLEIRKHRVLNKGDWSREFLKEANPLSVFLSYLKQHEMGIFYFWLGEFNNYKALSLLQPMI
jgi:hypothetical protein